MVCLPRLFPINIDPHSAIDDVNLFIQIGRKKKKQLDSPKMEYILTQIYNQNCKCVYLYTENQGKILV